VTTDDPNYIVIDIETVPSPRAMAYYATKRYDPPKNYKDPAKIEAYVQEARDEDAMKAALKWWTGQIVCIGLKSHKGNWLPQTWAGPNERELLCNLFDLLDREPLPRLIGKSADTFDKPYIIGRALSLNLGLPRALRPYRELEDVDHIFGLSARHDQKGRLADYAFGIGAPMKKGHGTDVAVWFHEAQAGDEKAWEKITNYCAGDVDITHLMLKRFLTPYRKA